MKPGDLVHICPGFPDIGVVIGPDIIHPKFSRTHKNRGKMTYPRTLVWFDGDINSVPTYQLEVIQ